LFLPGTDLSSFGLPQKKQKSKAVSLTWASAVKPNNQLTHTLRLAVRRLPDGRELLVLPTLSPRSLQMAGKPWSGRRPLLIKALPGEEPGKRHGYWPIE